MFSKNNNCKNQCLSVLKTNFIIFNILIVLIYHLRLIWIFITQLFEGSLGKIALKVNLESLFTASLQVIQIIMDIVNLYC